MCSQSTRDLGMMAHVQAGRYLSGVTHAQAVWPRFGLGGACVVGLVEIKRGGSCAVGLDGACVVGLVEIKRGGSCAVSLAAVLSWLAYAQLV